MTTRGIRNNNPLNIRRGTSKWQGLADEQKDSAFCQFQEQKYGWRAAFILICRTYYLKYHLATPYDIISRFAPASENNVDAYVKHVCKISGYSPHSVLPVPAQNPGYWLKLVSAMAIHESGVEGLDYYAMLDGWTMCRESIGLSTDNKL